MKTIVVSKILGWQHRAGSSPAMGTGNKMEDKIELTKEEYDILQKRDLKLSALESCGVDNWNGYDDAMDMYQDLLKEAGYEE